MGFLANSEWENFSKMDQMGDTFISRKCLWDFSPYGKNNPIGYIVKADRFFKLWNLISSTENAKNQEPKGSP
jgi:hypothetical protein